MEMALNPRRASRGGASSGLAVDPSSTASASSFARCPAALMRTVVRSAMDSVGLRMDHKYGFPHAALPLLCFACVQRGSRSLTFNHRSENDGVDLEGVTDIRAGACSGGDEDGRPERPHQLSDAPRRGPLADQVRAGLSG